MTQGEVISKLTHECCLAMGDFHYFQTVRTYIQMALVIGTEHFTKDMEEIIALYKDGVEAGRFKGIGEASKKLGIAQTCISETLAGKQHSAGGLLFMKTKDYELIPRNGDSVKPLHLLLPYHPVNT